jgi:hypothetical protein
MHFKKTVFPKFRELYMQNGCRFQAIDLRWGVPVNSCVKPCVHTHTLKVCLGLSMLEH